MFFSCRTASKVELVNRLVIFAPHFAEYSMRLAQALSAHAEVMLILDVRNRGAECSDALFSRVKKSVKIIEFDFVIKGRFRSRLLLAAIIARIKFFRPDIVHFQEQGDQITAALIVFVSRLCPTVLTIHDPKPHSGTDSIFAENVKAYVDLLRFNAAGFHVHGAYCEKLLRSATLVDKPLVSTSHGVLMELEDPVSVSRQPAALLFFGRMEAYKGLTVLLDAFDILRGRGHPLTLVIAGKGPELDLHEDRASSTENVTVLNRFLSPSEASILFQKASLVVVPYLDATQSGIIAAAFGNRRPVIASRVGGLVDAVTDGRSGVLVAPNDPSGLADAIEPFLKDDHKVEALIEGVFREAETRFSWPEIAATLMPFYRGLMH